MTLTSLTDEQRAVFKDVAIEQRQMSIVNEETMAELYAKLRHALKSDSPDEKGILAIVGDIRREQSMFEDRMRNLDEYLDRILTPLQLGQYLLLHASVETGENSK